MLRARAAGGDNVEEEAGLGGFGIGAIGEATKVEAGVELGVKEVGAGVLEGPDIDDDSDGEIWNARRV